MDPPRPVSELHLDGFEGALLVRHTEDDAK